MKITAALLTEINRPLEITELETGELSYGQVLVKILASGICGSQLAEIRGEKGRHFPRLLGHEGVGIVQRTGDGVKVVHGDKVIMHWRKGDGIESSSPIYFSLDRLPMTGGQVVTFATHSICSENRLTKVPDKTPNELCALLGCGLSTALGTIENEADLKFGETILIIGCGGLGLNLIRAAKLAQASVITGMDTVGWKKKPAIEAGATDFSIAGFGLNCARPFDVVIDTTGDASAIQIGLNCLGKSGRFIMVGQPKPWTSISIPNAHKMFDGEGKTIKATQGGSFNPSKDIPRYIAMHRAGLLDLTGIITHRIKLQDINTGLDLVRNGQAGRVLIEMEHE